MLHIETSYQLLPPVNSISPMSSYTTLAKKLVGYIVSFDGFLSHQVGMWDLSRGFLQPSIQNVQRSHL